MINTARILFVGDVVGRPGRLALKKWIGPLRETLDLDVIIVNGENSAGGMGITSNTAEEIFASGADCITSGNHVWHHKEAVELLKTNETVLRPANFPIGVSGNGSVKIRSRKDPGLFIKVSNLMGQVFMKPLDCPFRTMESILDKTSDSIGIHIVDFHAEATAEKRAFAQYFDGRLTAVLGTHTHVQTADEQILPHGTAFISDVGMTGPVESIIGMDPKGVLKQFLTKMPSKFEVAKGISNLNGVIVDADNITGKATSIFRIKKGSLADDNDKLNICYHNK